jgi:hypothetical protein
VFQSLRLRQFCNGFAAIYCFSELQAKAICNYNHNITAKKKTNPHGKGNMTIRFDGVANLTKNA